MSDIAPAAAEVKYCAVCGNAFERPRYLTPYTWAERKYCSKSCARRSASKQHQQAAQTYKEPEAKVCECGQPATTRVRFYILMNDNGELTPTTLQVCKPCAEIMKAEDKGVY